MAVTVETQEERNQRDILELIGAYCFGKIAILANNLAESPLTHRYRSDDKMQFEHRAGELAGIERAIQYIRERENSSSHETEVAARHIAFTLLQMREGQMFDRDAAQARAIEFSILLPLLKRMDPGGNHKFFSDILYR